MQVLITAAIFLELLSWQQCSYRPAKKKRAHQAKPRISQLITQRDTAVLGSAEPIAWYCF
jgi:hypothetical protein